MKKHLLLKTPGQTRHVARCIGAVLPRQAICLFQGPMACGKTTFIKGVAEGMGLSYDEVTSPTYTIANFYQKQGCSLVHVDFHQIRTTQAVRDMNEDDWLNPQGVTAIEWPEYALPLLEGLPVLYFTLAIPEPYVDPMHRTLVISTPYASYYADVFKNTILIKEPL